MSKWNTKRDLPVFWILMLLLVWVNINSKSYTVMIYLYGEDTKAQVVEFNSDFFYYEYNINDNFCKAKVKQHNRYVIDSKRIIPIKVYKTCMSIHLDEGGLLKLYTAFFAPILFLSIPIFVTITIIIFWLKGNPI